MKEIGVYIHIPFCKQKCLYCDFVSFGNKQDLQKEYVEALKKFTNIIVKFGRFRPDQPHHVDEVLGVELVNPEQYAKRIS